MRLIILTLILPTLLFARHKVVHHHEGADIPYVPWFTGPLLAPTPVNMKPGHPAIEPAITIFNTYGLYKDNWGIKSIDNIWGINPLVDYQFAITKNTGIEIIASTITNIRDGKSSTHFEDTTVLFGYQVSNDQKDSWVPDFRLFLQVVFPTGNYKKLNPELRGLDLTGEGAYFIGPNLSFQKLFYLPNNFFSLQWSIGYFFPTRTDIKGFNAYGGGIGAKGSILPGQNLIAFLSGEYSLNQNWVLMFDSELDYQREASNFKGNPGVLKDGTPSEVGRPTSFQITFAPEMAYNFSARSGLLWGAWFTVAGRNATAFASLFVAYVYIF